MSSFTTLRDGLCWTAVAAITVFFSLPALASEFYSWRTDDGGYAFASKMLCDWWRRYYAF